VHRDTNLTKTGTVVLSLVIQYKTVLNTDILTSLANHSLSGSLDVTKSVSNVMMDSNLKMENVMLLLLDYLKIVPK